MSVWCFTADVTLSQKLQGELNYETEANAQKEAPEFLKVFQDQGVWQVSAGVSGLPHVS